MTETQKIRPDLPDEYDCTVCGERMHRKPPSSWPFVDRKNRTHTLNPGNDPIDHVGKPLPEFRLTEHGKQVVRFGKYSYTWGGAEPLAIGDRCLLPGNWLFKEPSEAEVTGFGSDYDGDLSPVLRLIARGGAPATQPPPPEVTASDKDDRAWLAERAARAAPPAPKELAS